MEKYGKPMAYTMSFAHRRWIDKRRPAIDELEFTQPAIPKSGCGRFSQHDLLRAIAHAHAVRVVAEFQGFARDLHNVAAECVVVLAGTASQHQALLIRNIKEGRMLDSGNPTFENIQRDFKRVGIGDLRARVEKHDPSWKAAGRGTARMAGDAASLENLIQLRNSIAHGNDGQLIRLRTKGIRGTLKWTKGQLPALYRIVIALDRSVWDYFKEEFGQEPW